MPRMNTAKAVVEGSHDTLMAFPNEVAATDLAKAQALRIMPLNIGRTLLRID